MSQPQRSLVSVIVSDGNFGADVNFNSASSVASAAATLLGANVGVNASAVGGLLTLTGEAGDSVEIVSVVFAAVTTEPTSTAYNGATTFFGDAIVNPDVAHEVEIEVSGTPVNNDIYSLTTDFNAGGNTNSSYQVTGVETPTDVAVGLEAGFSDAFVTASVAGAVINLLDNDADNGAFDADIAFTEAFAGSGASPILTGADSDYQSADQILDFDGVTDGDEIDFTMLGEGNGSNYDEGAEVATYALAYAQANAAFAGSGGSMTYFMTSATDLDGAATTGQVNGQEGAGLLFVDANTDGQADLVVVLLNNTEDTFSAGMIA
ncbi:hypothetical protein [Parasphingorhabdus sp.]|uniref:hypothetical protein n=1 Tax=Parasphingorhabdus sp. TaxID=2709688 RepID=UPI0030038D04